MYYSINWARTRMIYRTLLLAIASWMFLLSAASGGAREDVVELLKARDAQFDNIQLNIRRSVVIDMSKSEAWDKKMPSDPLLKKKVRKEAVSGESSVFSYSLLEKIVIKGAEATYQTERDPASDSSNRTSKYRVGAGEYWTSRPSEIKSFSIADGSASIDNIPGQDIGSRARITKTLLCAGVGLTGRIIDVESVNVTESGGYKIEGRMAMSMPDFDVRKFSCLLDAEMIIRDGWFVANGRQRTHAYHLVTFGRANADVVSTALSGTLEEFVVPTAQYVGGVEPSVEWKKVDSLAVEVLALKHHLSATDYTKAVEPIFPAGVVLRSSSASIPIRAPAPGARMPSGVWLYLLNGAALAVVIGALVLRRYGRTK